MPLVSNAESSLTPLQVYKRLVVVVFFETHRRMVEYLPRGKLKGKNSGKHRPETLKPTLGLLLRIC